MVTSLNCRLVSRLSSSFLPLPFYFFSSLLFPSLFHLAIIRLLLGFTLQEIRFGVLIRSPPLIHKRMAAIHDRYTVLPSQRLRRPGALLRTVLRHKDYAGDRHPHDRIQVTGQTAGQVTGQVLLPTIAGHEYHPGYSGAIGPQSSAALRIQGPPTATALAAALTAPTGAPSPSIPAGLAPGPPILPPAPLRPSPNFSPLSIRHARSTSSPLPLHAAPPASASTPASAPEKRRARLSSPIATMPEYRHMRSGSLSIPNGAHGSSHHHSSMPRSPPSRLHQFAVACARILASLPHRAHPRAHDHGEKHSELAADALTVCCCLQTHRTFRASFSAKEPVRPAMPVPLAMI